MSGYELVDRIDKPKSDDIVVCWNRYGHWHEEANRFEASGARVVVVENGWLGKSWLGGSWYAMALGHHAGAGTWVDGGPDRWDSLGVDLMPWRHVNDGETVILGQRGIGENGIASPVGWAERTKRKIGGRIRVHPGNKEPTVPLEQDLAKASAVVTWASSAALWPLVWGIPVWHEMSSWIGAKACRPLSEWPEPKRSDKDRLAMFRRLIWAQWRLTEIEDGTAFRHLLG